MKIYLASSNEHKRQEMAAIFPRHHIVLPADEGIAFDPEENGKSFIENSLIKAKVLWEIVHKPVIADDSGICVDILDGIPGIYSARYAGKTMHTGTPDGRKLPQEEQNRLLLEEVEEAIADNYNDNDTARTCRYVCAMVLYLGPDRFYSVQETMEGRLVQNLKEASGTGGFGYDPIVVIENHKKTVAELSADEKNRISHRGKAGRGLNAILNAMVPEA